MTNAIKCIFLFILSVLYSKCEIGMNESTLERRQMEGFIVGGSHTDITNYPHSVYLQVACYGSAWTCGASILNQRIVITAAHCLFMCNLQNGKDRISMFAGSENIRKVKFARYARGFVTHENYDEKQVTNDIGLIVTDGSIPLGKNTKRLIIRSRFPKVVGGYVAGWGSIDDVTGVTSTRLKHVYQKLRSKSTCKKVGKLHSGMFCAGELGFYDDHPAEGDSGSALVTKTFIGVGIVSFRVGKYPAILVYTNISYYFKWVRQKARKLYCI